MADRRCSKQPDEPHGADAFETGRFLEEHDLAGPAELTRVSGVNGADLLQLSIHELSQDIRLTPFAARKVDAAREEFLRVL